MIVKKSDLPWLASFKGMVNDAAFKLGDNLHQTGTLKFVGFNGRHVGDGNYDGELLFESVVEGAIVERLGPFSNLYGFPDKSAPKRVSRSRRRDK